MKLLDKQKRRSNKGNLVVTKVYGEPKPRRSRHRPNRGGCFPAGTRVLTPFGQRAIEELVLGDLVVSYGDGRFSIQPILQIVRLSSRSIVEIFLSARERPIRTTRSHSFSGTKGWVTAAALRVGDNVHTVELGSVSTSEVIAIRPVAECSDVYRLVTASAHTFIAEGVVAHNFTHLRALRSFLYRYFFDSVLNANNALINSARIFVARLR